MRLDVAAVLLACACRTTDKLETTLLCSGAIGEDRYLVGAAGLEPATLGLEIRCSIRLSYAPMFLFR
jgi:hypothetical protein